MTTACQAALYNIQIQQRKRGYADFAVVCQTLANLFSVTFNFLEGKINVQISPVVFVTTM